MKRNLQGLLRLDEEWRKRIEQALPNFGVLLARANGLSPHLDGRFTVSRSYKVNAQVRLGPEYIIHQGALLALMDVAAILACNADFMPDYFPTAFMAPNIVPNVKARFLDYKPLDEGKMLPEFVPQVPKDRVEVFAEVFVSAVSFLLLHEQAHFLNGHFEYYRQVYGAAEYLEAADSSSNPTDDPLTRRALEIDADATACGIHLLSAVKYDDEYNDFQMTREALYGHEKEVIIHFVGCAVMMALLSYVDAHSKVEKEKRTHPRAAIRFMVLEGIFHSFLEDFGCDASEIDTFFATAIRAVHFAYILLDQQDELGHALLLRADQDSHAFLEDIVVERNESFERLAALRGTLNQMRESVQSRYK